MIRDPYWPRVPGSTPSNVKKPTLWILVGNPVLARAGDCPGDLAVG